MQRDSTLYELRPRPETHSGSLARASVDASSKTANRRPDEKPVIDIDVLRSPRTLDFVRLALVVIVWRVGAGSASATLLFIEEPVALVSLPGLAGVVQLLRRTAQQLVRHKKYDKKMD
jgi:hypothetical protein